jgi:hypothetical protein
LGIEKMIAKNGVDGTDLIGFFELNNGCICCTVKDDLLATLEQLVLHKSKFDYILIETTGSKYQSLNFIFIFESNIISKKSFRYSKSWSNYRCSMG